MIYQNVDVTSGFLQTLVFHIRLLSTFEGFTLYLYICFNDTIFRCAVSYAMSYLPLGRSSSFLHTFFASSKHSAKFLFNLYMQYYQ